MPQIELRGQPASEQAFTTSFDNTYCVIAPPAHEPKILFATSCDCQLQIIENAHQSLLIDLVVLFELFRQNLTWGRNKIIPILLLQPPVNSFYDWFGVVLLHFTLLLIIGLRFEDAKLFRNLEQELFKQIQPHITDVIEIQTVQKKLPMTFKHLNHHLGYNHIIV